MMNKLMILSCCMMLSFMSFGQASTAEYKAENPGWIVDVDEAYALSQKTGKPILANFTGSDWCGWCKRLTKSVFIHDEFKTWADKNVILLELDFPRRKQLPQELKAQNQQLAQAFGVRGYPTVWLFNLGKKADSNEFEIDAIGKTGYTKTAGLFIDALEQMMAAK